jgi:hypothetical protein
LYASELALVGDEVLFAVTSFRDDRHFTRSARKNPRDDRMLIRLFNVSWRVPLAKERHQGPESQAS